MQNLLQEQLLKQLLNAQQVMVLTGAGMSAESGIPTFRDAQTGMWAQFRPEDLATPEAFRDNPGRVWRWYKERRENVRAAQPHRGHYALVRMDSLFPALTVVTQNVDGLHQMAGSKGVVELHGNIKRSKCSVTHRPISGEWLKDSEGEPPPSPYVRNGWARPDVVWFGEVLSQDAIDQATAAAQRPTQFDLVAKDRQQAVVVPRLFNEVASSESDGLDCDLDAAPGRHHHHWQGAVHPLQLFQELETFGARCRVSGVVEVNEGGIEFAARRSGLGLVWRIGRFDRVALRFEQQAQRLQHIGLIVGDQNARRFFLRTHSDLRIPQSLIHIEER